MAWVSVHESIDGPKLRELYKKLGCSKFEATGILVYLWFWGLQNADKMGLIVCADEEDISRYMYGVGAGSNLDMNDVVKALIDTGWIDKKGNDIFIHDWETWQKEWYRYKARLRSDAARKREERAKKACKNNSSAEGEKVALEPPGNGASAKKLPNPKESERKKLYNPSFEEFWAVYPRKVEKANASKAFDARVKQGWRPEEIIQAAGNYAEECRRNRTETKYIKHGATFLSAATPFVDYLPENVIDTKHNADYDLQDDSNPFEAFMLPESE